MLQEPCVTCSSMIFKTVFSVTLMGNQRGTSCLCPQWYSVFNTRETGSPETTRCFENQLSKRHLKIRTDQTHKATSMQSHARANMRQHQRVPNRWGNHRWALAHAAEAAQVVGTVLSLCARVAVDFKDTTFVSERKSYEMPLSTWDVQLSTGMQQR